MFWWLRARRITRRLGHLLDNWRLEVRARLAGFSLSVALHALIFVVLSLIMIPVARRMTPPSVEAEFGRAVDSIVPGPGGDGEPHSVSFTVPAGPPPGKSDAPEADSRPQPAESAAKTEVPVPAVVPSQSATQLLFGTEGAPMASGGGYARGGGSATGGNATEAAAASVSPSSQEPAHETTISVAGVSGTPGGLEGRDPAARGRLLSHYGGTPSSEAAVAAGLRWLVLHQRADGSWNFNHQNEVCNGYCANPGKFPSTTAATGLALLPFLGAGNTHLVGEHSETVRRGIYYLASRVSMSDKGADLQEGSMYSQGLAAIALSEAYALSHDEALRPYAQSALDFIVHAQDPVGGGWRYAPLEPGDTTVSGWQLMALKSGMLAGLSVPPSAFELAGHFLDGVETDYGAAYGYQRPGKGTTTTTAIGVLGRMYTGWRRDRPALVAGVKRLERLGPSKNDMYYNYYATQVLRHYGGAGWDRWNKILRDRLVATQAREGHPRGSWYFNDPHGDVGGRLYITCMAIMTLEVYYRYMPLYSTRAAGN